MTTVDGKNEDMYENSRINLERQKEEKKREEK